MSTIFFDLETGGLELTHPIIEFGASVVEGGQEIDMLHRRLKFNPAECTEESLQVNGYSAELWKDAIEPKHLVEELVALFKRHSSMTLISKAGNPYKVARLAGHNVVSFDVPRLRNLMDTHYKGFWPACWWYPLDTYQRTIWWFTEKRIQLPNDLTLQGLARRFGIPVTAAHTALSDARTAATLAARLVSP